MGTFVAGKPRSTLKKFLDDHFLKRLSPFIRYCKNQASEETKANAGGTRQWPESEKDKKIKTIIEERKKKEDEERARLEELAQQNQGEEPEANQEVEDLGPTEEELKAAADEEARKAAEANAAKDDEEDIDEDEKSLEGDYYDEEDESNN